MAEYIERKTLIKQFCERCNEEMSESPCEPSECFAMEVIKAIPSADVEPVRHGRWETANDGTHFCSKCGWDATYTWDDIDRSFINSADDVPDRITNYCPNCGAKMDGGAE